MKSMLGTLYIMALCTIVSAQPATDTAVSPPTDTVATSSKKYTLELIKPDKYQAVVEYLSNQGVTVNAADVVSMGFEADKTSLVVIVLDSQGLPTKQVVPTDNEFYQAIMAAPALVPAPAPELPAISITKPTATDSKQEGRLYFMTHTSLKSLYVYPYAYSTIFNKSNGSTVAGLSLLTFGGSIYAAYKFTSGRELGYGRVAMLNYGGELALTYAQLMKWFVHSQEERKPRLVVDYYGYGYYNEYYDESEIWPASCDLTKAWINMLGFPLGIYLGSKADFVGNYDYGRAATMRFFGRSAILYGMLVPWLFFDDEGSYLFNTLSSEYSYNDSKTQNYAAISSLLTMGLIPLGNYFGYTLTKDRPISSGRSFLIETTGIMGTITGFLLPTLFEAETKNVYLAMGLIGHAAGTAVGFNYHKSQDYQFSQGTFMALSAAGGAAMALAFPILVEADDHQAYTVAAMLGGWGGLILGENLSLKIFEKSGKDRQSLNIDLPVLWQWPLLVSSIEYSKKGHGLSRVAPKAELISIEF